MKVELQCGDCITIPEGCKATIKDRSVVFEKEEKEKVQEFKDGDVLCSFYNDTMLIFKDVNKCARDYFDCYYNNKGFDNKRWYSESFRHASEEEKQLLFDKMEEQGLKWNAEEKRVEKIRWRSEYGKDYYYIGGEGLIMVAKEGGICTDKNRYDFSNYFRTYEQAEEAAKRVKEVLIKYHEEIGE
ncbi:MAG: hypothetical protein HXN96_08010 [Prevotella salivae]|nr:hypothetical protein [Segatella salivae]